MSHIISLAAILHRRLEQFQADPPSHIVSSGMFDGTKQRVRCRYLGVDMDAPLELIVLIANFAWGYADSCDKPDEHIKIVCPPIPGLGTAAGPTWDAITCHGFIGYVYDFKMRAMQLARVDAWQFNGEDSMAE